MLAVETCHAGFCTATGTAPEPTAFEASVALLASEVQAGIAKKAVQGKAEAEAELEIKIKLSAMIARRRCSSCNGTTVRVIL